MNTFYIPYFCCCKNFTNICFSDGPENVQITGPSEVHVGKSFTLTCSADSTPSATYTWKLNGTEIHNSTDFTKNNADLSDSGSYTCQAMNSITERTSTAVHGLSVTGTEMVLIVDVGITRGPTIRYLRNDTILLRF